VDTDTDDDVADDTVVIQLLYAGVCSDLPSVVSVWPYFWPAEIPHSDDGVHLVVCVHGLDGLSVLVIIIIITIIII